MIPIIIKTQFGHVKAVALANNDGRIKARITTKNNLYYCQNMIVNVTPALVYKRIIIGENKRADEFVGRPDLSRLKKSDAPC